MMRFVDLFASAAVYYLCSFHVLHGLAFALAPLYTFANIFQFPTLDGYLTTTLGDDEALNHVLTLVRLTGFAEFIVFATLLSQRLSRTTSKRQITDRLALISCLRLTQHVCIVSMFFGTPGLTEAHADGLRTSIKAMSAFALLSASAKLLVSSEAVPEPDVVVPKPATNVVSTVVGFVLFLLMLAVLVDPVSEMNPFHKDIKTVRPLFSSRTRRARNSHMCSSPRSDKPWKKQACCWRRRGEFSSFSCVRREA